MPISLFGSSTLEYSEVTALVSKHSIIQGMRDCRMPIKQLITEAKEWIGFAHSLKVPAEAYAKSAHFQLGGLGEHIRGGGG